MYRSGNDYCELRDTDMKDIYVHIHVYTHVVVFMCLCFQTYVYAYIYTRTYIQTNMYTYVCLYYTYIYSHTLIYTCVGQRPGRYFANTLLQPNSQQFGHTLFINIIIYQQYTGPWRHCFCGHYLLSNGYSTMLTSIMYLFYYIFT